MPQTREHLDILTLLGVRHGLVALTKIDLVADEPMRRLAVEDVRAATAGTFLEGAPICPVSSVTGEGFDAFYEALNATVDACRARAAEGIFRMWIERSFSIRGFGAVATGVCRSGSVRVGDRLTLQPGGQVGRVRRLEVYGAASDVARPGECAAINLDGVDADLLTRGRVLCGADVFEPTTMFEAELTLLDRLPRPVKDNAELHLHIGTAEVMAKAAMLAGGPSPPGAAGFVQFRLAEPLSVAPGERLVVRGSLANLAGGRVTTLGGARVLGVSGVKLRRRRPWVLENLAERRDAIDSPRDWLATVAKQAPAPMTLAELARAARFDEPTTRRWIESLAAKGVLLTLADGRLAHTAAIDRAAEGVRSSLETFHRENPRHAGRPRAELIAGAEADAALADAAVERLLDAGALERRGEVLAIPGLGSAVSDAQRALCDRVAAELERAQLEPPLPADLAGAVGADESAVEAALELLAEQGRAVRLDRKVAMAPSAIDRAAETVLELFRRAPGFTTTEFRDALGVSRKYAVPLLDYFDTRKLTVRSASRRTPGVEARRRLG
jgi:selenocysteine-specific elongation factor